MEDLFQSAVADTFEPQKFPALIERENYSYVECMNRDEWLNARKHYLVPASEVPMIMGDFKGKSSVRLAMEKSGMADPADLSDDEMINRGREREPVIRREFAERHPSLKVTYHPFRIYVSKERPWMSCTLDGECVVTMEDPKELKEGSEGCIECKSVGYRSKHELDEFMRSSAPAAKFYEQCLAQMYVRHLDFAYLIVEYAYIGAPEMQGDCPDYQTREFLITRDRDVVADIRIILEACDAFKAKMDAGQLPDTQLSTSDDGSEVVVLQAEVEVGRFLENFDKVKTSVEHMVEPYKGAVYTEETAKDARTVHAELNAMGNAIDEKRKALKKKYLEPYNEFEAKAKALKQIIDDVKEPISEQLKQFDMTKRNRKIAEINDVIASIIDEKIPDEEIKSYYYRIGGVEIKDKWLLAKTSRTQVRDEISLTVMAFIGDYNAITAVCGDDHEMLSMLLSEYERTRTLSDALMAKDRILNARRQAESIRKSQEEANRMKEDAEPAIWHQPEPAVEKNQGASAKTYTFTFRASHTSQAEWKALIAYMKQHGFSYEQIR